MLKKLPFLLALAAITVFSSCKKDEEKEEPIAEGTWTVGSESYVANIGALYNNAANVLIASDKTTATNTASLFFKSKPAANGTYTVLNALDVILGLPINDGECVLSFNSSGVNYNSTGKVGDKVTIAVNSGKITASFSGIEVVNGTLDTDKKSASGNIKEK
jgi:hypothetical protein